MLKKSLLNRLNVLNGFAMCTTLCTYSLVSYFFPETLLGLDDCSELLISGQHLLAEVWGYLLVLM